MLTSVQFDIDVFVKSLVGAARKMHDMDIKPASITIPQTTFNHFKKSQTYDHFFKDQPKWKKRLWNSKHNPINFETPMFMGMHMVIVPDKDTKKDICYMHPTPQYGDIKIPFEYSLKMVLEHKIRTNIGYSILIKSRARDYEPIPKNEWNAIDTLREMITETEFRKYMKYGFILVQGKSGNTYQIFRYNKHIKVWNNGKVVEEICLRIKNLKIPPTDKLIAFKFMIETDEEDFKKLGNVYNMRKIA